MSTGCSHIYEYMNHYTYGTASALGTICCAAAVNLFHISELTKLIKLEMLSPPMLILFLMETQSLAYATLAFGNFWCDSRLSISVSSIKLL